MNELVFIEPDKLDSVPFTTSKVISEFSGVRHDKIKAAINKYKTALETFGLSTSYKGESTGGRPEVIYKLNEEQATFLMTLLKNTEIVVEFKRRLVKQFSLMKNELSNRKTYREELKPIRRSLTDVIQGKPDHNEWEYKNFIDLSYKAVTGKIAKAIRKERGAKKDDPAIEYMTSDEMKKIEKKTDQITTLCELGFDYKQIKSILLNKQLVCPTVSPACLNARQDSPTIL